MLLIALGVGIAKNKKFPVPFGERPIDRFCVEAIAGLAFTNTPAGVDSVIASPSEVILNWCEADFQDFYGFCLNTKSIGIVRRQ